MTHISLRKYKEHKAVFTVMIPVSWLEPLTALAAADARTRNQYVASLIWRAIKGSPYEPKSEDPDQS